MTQLLIAVDSVNWTAVTFTSASAAYGIVAVEVYVAGAGPVASRQGFYRGRVR